MYIRFIQLCLEPNYFLKTKISMLNLNFSPFPVFKTERLVLRQVMATDAQSVMKIRGNEEAMRYIPRPRARTIEDALGVIEMLTGGVNEGKSINWAICNIENPEEIFGIMGYVNFYPDECKAEIGYMLHPDYWGKGYINEAIKVIEDYGFKQIGINVIEAKIDPQNQNSLKILLRNNYSFDKLIEKSMVFEEQELDSAYYIKEKIS